MCFFFLNDVDSFILSLSSLTFYSKEFAGCLREVADWLRQARPLDAKLLFERSASIYASTVGVNSKEQ